MNVHTSVVDSLYAQIRNDILCGRFRPGTVLRQEDIAKMFSVSRVPVREAFSRLEAEGFLNLRPRRGYAVVSLNPEEISEIFDLRMVVEAHAGQVATRKRTAQDVAEVTAFVDRMEALEVSAEDYFAKWCELNRQFHERLIRSCRRERLLKTLLQLRDIVEPYIRLEMMITGHSKEADLDHRAIANAFAEGNADLVGSLSAAHVGRTASRLLRALTRSEAETGNGSRQATE